MVVQEISSGLTIEGVISDRLGLVSAYPSIDTKYRIYNLFIARGEGLCQDSLIVNTCQYYMIQGLLTVIAIIVMELEGPYLYGY